MKPNPVYKMEKMTSSRSIRMAGIIFGMNLVLTAAALVIFYTMSYEIRYTGQIPYQAFIRLYKVIAYFEFGLVLFIVPALTAGTISGERERQTLDLLLSTNMSCWDIIIGKLTASFRTVLIVIISGFPVLSLVFIYGGVSGFDLLCLLAYYVLTAAFAGSLGMMLSSLFRRTVAATAVSYVVLLLLNVGTLLIVYMIYEVSFMKYMDMLLPDFYPSAGNAIYLLLLNPAVAFYCFMTGQTGSRVDLYHALELVGVYEDSVIMQHWVTISVVIQLLLSALFVCVAVWRINPAKKAGLKLTFKS